MALPGRGTYRKLLLAQVIALLGTGLATVALGLLAYDLTGVTAGALLGALLGVKMVANVVVAPVAAALADRLPRRRLLVAADLVRAGVAACLPFAGAVWQVVVLVVALQVASATFTPAYQAALPAVLPDEEDYTRALSLSRLAHDLEGLLSPVLAAALLSLVGFSWLFAGTALGFLASAALVRAAALPASPRPDGPRPPIWERTLRGARIYLATPRLRAQIGLNLAAAAAGAVVLVDTVVFVRADLGGSDSRVALALGAFGCGSMLAALLLPRALARVPDRAAATTAAVALAVLLAALAAAYAAAPAARWPVLLVGWGALGAGYSTILTPVGRLVRRSGHARDWPALFAAQFALSHAAWLLTYPLAGVLGSAAGAPATMAAMAAVAACGAVHALRTWPRRDPAAHEHVHADLDADHPHLRDARPTRGGWRHAHRFVVDEVHPRWPAGAAG